MLRHLTQPDAYKAPPSDASLQGLDPARLRLVGRLALAKRMRKVEAVLPATVHCIAHRAPHLISAFAECYPSNNPARFVNAEQLHDFLLNEPGDGDGRPAYLEDLVRCELAVARSGRHAKLTSETAPSPAPPPVPGALWVRTRPGLAIVAFRYDIRKMLEDPASPPPAVVPEASGWLAIVPGPAEGTPRTLRIDRRVVDLLEVLASWAALPETGDGRDLLETVRDLGRTGLLEVSRCASA